MLYTVEIGNWLRFAVRPFASGALARLAPAVLAPVVVALGAGSAAGQCTPRWSQQFASDGFNGGVYSLQEYRPAGQAPVLLAGGQFTRIRDQAADGTIKWNGQGWDSMSEGMRSPSAFAILDPDGPGPQAPVLYAAGAVNDSTTPPYAVFRFDGSQWVRVGQTFNGWINALVVFDPDGPDGPLPPELIAGGWFTTDNGGFANHIARFNGTSWVQLGAGLNDAVNSFCVFDEDGDGPNPPRLLIGGGGLFFSNFTPLEPLARWDGQTFAPVPLSNDLGWTGYISSLAVFDPDGPGPRPAEVVIGGSFTIQPPVPAGAPLASNIVKYDGTNFSGLSNGVNGFVSKVVVIPDPATPEHNPALFACGSFTAAGNTGANRIARWDGDTWAALDVGANAYVSTIAAFDPDGDGPLPAMVVASGDFLSIGGHDYSRIAAWDGRDWRPMGSFASLGLNSGATCMTVMDEDGPGPNPPSVIVGGWFSSAGDQAIRGIARWNGREWSQLGGGLDGLVNSMVFFDALGRGEPQLVVGGSFSRAGGLPEGNIAVWDGANWSAFPVRLPGGGAMRIETMAVFDPDGDGPLGPELYVGGSFDIFITSTGLRFRNIAKFNGTSWVPVGGGLSGAVTCMTVFDEDGPGGNPPRLFVGGQFSSAGFNPSVPCSGIARWNGTAWSSVGTGVNQGVSGGSVSAMAVYDPDGAGPAVPQLYVAGSISRVGNVNVRGIGRWNGAAWSGLLGSQSANVGPTNINTLSVSTPGGSGQPSLLIGGGFSFNTTSSFTSPVANGIARYNGTAFSTIEGPTGGVSGVVYSILAVDDDADGPNGFGTLIGGNFNSCGSPSTTYSAQSFARFSPGNEIGIITQPDDQILRPGQNAEFRAAGRGQGTLTYQWRRNGVALSNGAAPSGAVVSGATTQNLRITSVAPSDAGEIDVVVTGSCGGMPSRVAALFVLCAADFNGDQAIDANDLGDFITGFFNDPPDPRCDFDGSGQVTADDLADFVTAYFDGC